MLNEKRVMHMTRMAMVEDKQIRELRPATRYRKRDYVALCTLGGIFLGTLIYALLYAGAVLFIVSVWMVNIHLVGLILGLVLGLVLYILYMYFYLRMVRRHAVNRYDTGMTLLRELRKDYRILNDMYQEEEWSKTPEGWD